MTALPKQQVTREELTRGYAVDAHNVKLGENIPRNAGGRTVNLYQGDGGQGHGLSYTARKDGTQPIPSSTALADLLRLHSADGRTLPTDFAINEYSLANFDRKLLDLHRSIGVLSDPIGSLRLKLADLYAVRNAVRESDRTSESDSD